MRVLVRRFSASQDATAALEFGLIAPVLLLLAGGITEFGRALQANNEANRLAAQYAIAFADCSDEPAGKCATELVTFGNANTTANISPTLTPANVTVRMFQVKMNGTTPVVTYAHPTGSTLNATQIAAAREAVAAGETGVVVTVTYTHNIALMQKVMSPFLGTSLSFPYTIAQLKS